MASKFLELPNVHEHLARATQSAARLMATAVIPNALAAREPELQSPLEAIFLIWWEAYAAMADPFSRLELHAQFGLAPRNGRHYIPDFVITERDVPYWEEGNRLGVRWRWIVIELDGHDFHERTKEQVAARNQRDRDIQDAGHKVLHFSGSEFHRDPENGINDVIYAISSGWNTYKAALKKAKAGG